MANYEDLYRRYATDVLRMCCFYLGNRQQAEDVTQDVFVKLLTTAPTLEEGREKSWLLKVALNRCKDLWRGAWAKRVVLGSPQYELAPSPDTLGQREEEQALWQAVQSLPTAFRETVLLYYYENYSIGEIAQLLEISEGTVSSRLSRGRKQLEKMLGKEESL